MFVNTADVIIPSQTAEDSVVWTIPSSAVSYFATDSKDKTATVRCTTRDSDGTLVGTTVTTVTLRIPNTAEFAPTLSSVAIAPTGGYTNYIGGLNNIQVTFTDSAKNNASIQMRSMHLGYFTFADTANPWTLDPSSLGGAYTPTAKTRDSRGLSATITLPSVTIYSYSAPRLIPYGDGELYCARVNQYGVESRSGTYFRVKLGRSFSKIPTDNPYCTLICEVAEKSDTPSWGYPITLIDRSETDTPAYYDNFPGGEPSVSIPLFDFEISDEKAYLIRITATDKIGQSASTTFTLPARGVTFHLANDGNGVGVGRYASGGNKFEVAYDTYLEGDLYLGGHKLVESGTDNGWNYRKYADGKVEAHKTLVFYDAVDGYDFDTSLISGKIVYWYKCTEIGTIQETLPTDGNGNSLFSATPSISASVNGLFAVFCDSANANSIQLELASPCTRNYTQSIAIHLYCTL